MNLLGCKKEDIIPVSAKTGQNVEAILDAVMDRVPQPIVYKGDLNPENQELKALVFDSQYDPYRGVVSYVKVFS
jgi:GTP-binding protein LepA